MFSVSRKHGEFFHLELEGGKIFAENVIWAGGEYQYPSLGGFEQVDELCLHTSNIGSYQELDGDDFLIIGGYESGIDAAYHLANNGNNARVFDMNCPWGEEMIPTHFRNSPVVI